MQFSRNKFTKVLLILAGILILLLAGIFVYRAKFSADSVDQNDTSFLDNMEDKPNLNDPTIIRLPSIYSKEDIQKALNNSTATGVKGLVSAKDKEIANYICSKAEKTAKSLPIINIGTKANPIANDLIFLVADSKGNVITPISKPNKNSIKTVADNFEFDSVPESLKDEMIKFYPIVESIYGSRQNTDKIKVVVKADVNRAYFSSAINTITLGEGNDGKVALHEMVHAFHGYRCVPSLWEEGAAVKVSALADKAMGLFPDDMSIKTGYNLNYENLPSTYDPQIWNDAWNSYVPYAYGSMILDKIYLDDPDFFKKFNQKLYSYSGYNYRQPSLLARFATQSVERIEGEESWSWFSHQYPYIEMNQDSYQAEGQFYAYIASSVNRGYWINDGIGVGSAPKGGEGPANQESFVLTIKTNYTLDDSSDFIIKLLNESGQSLVESDKFATHQRLEKQIDKIYVNPSVEYKSYQGLVNIEITPVEKPEAKKTISFLKTEERPDNKDVYAYSKSGKIAQFSALDGSTSEIVEKSNGYFSLKKDWLHSAGRFKIEVFNKKTNCSSADLKQCIAAKVNEKYFNKSELSDLYLDLGVGNTCGLTIKNVKPLNRSFSIETETKNSCGQVLSVNRIPIARFWGKNDTFTKYNLPKNKTFRYQLTYASDSSKIARKIGSLKTLDQPDFKLLSAQDYGSVIDDNFSRQYKFNQEYDIASVNLEIFENSGRPGDNSSVAIKIEKVDDLTLKIIPEQRLYNNANYMVDGLYKVKDKFGNPIVGMNWDLTNIFTPVNPADRALPEYKILSQTDKIEIGTNFKSGDLINKLQEIRLFRMKSDEEFCIYDCPEYIEFSSQIVDQNAESQKITIVPKEPLSSGENYYLTFPSVIDENNNLVSNQYANFIAN